MLNIQHKYDSKINRRHIFCFVWDKKCFTLREKSCKTYMSLYNITIRICIYFFEIHTTVSTLKKTKILIIVKVSLTPKISDCLSTEELHLSTPPPYPEISARLRGGVLKSFSKSLVFRLCFENSEFSEARFEGGGGLIWGGCLTEVLLSCTWKPLISLVRFNFKKFQLCRVSEQKLTWDSVWIYCSKAGFPTSGSKHLLPMEFLRHSG